MKSHFVYGGYRDETRFGIGHLPRATGRWRQEKVGHLGFGIYPLSSLPIQVQPCSRCEDEGIGSRACRLAFPRELSCLVRLLMVPERVLMTFPFLWSGLGC